MIRKAIGILLLFASLTVFAQTSAMEIWLEVHRFPVNHNGPDEFYREPVVIIMRDRDLGIRTSCDTLALLYRGHIDADYSKGIQSNVYLDEVHNQLYTVLFHRSESGEFSMRIEPVEPFDRDLYTIYLKSL